MTEPVQPAAGLPQLVRLLAASERILVFTGAGVSTGSGIPDFRGPQGIWHTRTPIYFQEFMADPEARRNYWQQKLEDRADWGNARPNPTHHAIADLDAAGKVAMVVTQNIDGLHAAAGTPVDHLVEVHGTVGEIECMSCGARSDPEPAFAAFEATSEPPRCSCGGFLKSATISFGQQLRAADLARAFAAADECDLVLALGSTLSVTPAADIPLTAARRGVPYVIVNLGQTEHDRLVSVTLRIEGDVGDVVPAAVTELLEDL
jgi:NAD-dependent deacetylase